MGTFENACIIRKHFPPFLRNTIKYYRVLQFRSIWIWLHVKVNESRWISTKKQEMQKSLLNVVPFMGNRNKQCTMTNNTIIQNTFVSWQDAHLSIDSKGSLFKNTSLWTNPNIPNAIVDNPLKSWMDKGIKIVGYPYTEDHRHRCSSFQQLSRKYYLPHHNLFKSDTGSKKTHPEDFLTYRRRLLWRNIC